MKKRLIAAIVAAGLGASVGAATDSAMGLRVNNPEQRIMEYVAWTALNTRPPSLRPTEGLDRYKIVGICFMAVPPNSKKYYGCFPQAINFANDLVKEPEVTPIMLEKLYGLLISKSGGAPLQAEDGFVNKHKIDVCSTDLLNLLLLFSRLIKSAQRARALDRMPHSSGDVDERLQALVNALSQKNGDGILELHDSWVDTYSKVHLTFAERVSSPTEFPIGEFIAELQREDEALADHLFATSAFNPGALPAKVATLCAMINSTAGWTPGNVAFESVFAKVEEIFKFILKNYIGFHFDGGFARMVANIILARAGLLPVCFAGDRYEKMLRVGLGTKGIFARAFEQQSLKMQEWWDHVRALTVEEAESILAGGRPIHLINEYEESEEMPELEPYDEYFRKIVALFG